MKVFAGKTIDLSVEAATDSDHWKIEDTDHEGYDNDTVTYTWSATSGDIIGDANQRNAKWKAPMDAGTYTLTCTIDDTPKAIGAQEQGSRDDSAITRTVEVEVINGESSATLKLYKDDALTEEVDGDVGGTAYIVLEVKLGAGQHLVSSSATLRVEENYPQHSETERRWDTAINLSSGWQMKDANGDWQTTSATPQSTNTTEDNEYFRMVWPWQTTTTPLGHNETHTIKLVNVDGGDDTELTFAPETGDGETKGPSGISADVANLVFGEVGDGKVTTNVNKDYFIFDPDSDNTARKTPEFKFKIEDKGDPHKYRWWVYIEPTTQSEPVESWALISGKANANETVTATWNGKPGDGSGNQPVLVAGTYTFDIYIQEVEDSDDPSSPVMDQAWLKSDCLDFTDHYFQINDNLEEDRKAEVGFKISSTNGLPATAVQVDLIDFDFAQVTTTSLPTNVGVMYGPISVHQMSEAEDGAGWRAVFMAEDQCGLRQRDHKNRRVWAVNQAVGGWVVYWIDENTPNTGDINQAYIEGAFRNVTTKISHAGIQVVPVRVQLTANHMPAANQIDWARRSRYNRAAVVWEGDMGINQVWPGITLMGNNGNLDAPRISQYSQSVIEKDPFFQDPEPRRWAASNVALHELGHALGLDNNHHEDVVTDPYCVMYYRLNRTLGQQIGSNVNPIHFGGRPHTLHAIRHWNAMREFIGLPPLAN